MGKTLKKSFYKQLLFVSNNCFWNTFWKEAKTVETFTYFTTDT